MINKIPVMILILYLSIFLITGCKAEVYSEKPDRPANVPDTSIWVGGPDGGVFVFIRKSVKNDKHLFDAEIHYASGDLAYIGLMKLYPENAAEFKIDKKESYIAWDGDKLYLSNNRYLEVQE